jgi:hypothetical protein
MPGGLASPLIDQPNRKFCPLAQDPIRKPVAIPDQVEGMLFGIMGAATI